MQTIPFNEELEKAIIVAVLSDPQIIHKVSENISWRDFYRQSHQEIFRIIEEIGPDNLDSLAVEAKIVNENTKEYYRNLIADSEQLLPSLSNVVYYSEIIKSKSKLRAGIDLGQQITALCFAPNADADQTLANLEQLFARFLQERVLQDNARTTQQEFADFIASLGQSKKDVGVKSGFYDLDLMLHRLEGLIILAARPGMGKTAMSINIARNVASHSPVLFFSLEQTKEQVFERLLSAESEIPLEEIRTQAYLADKLDTATIESASESLRHPLTHLYIDDTPNVNTAYITSASRQKKFELGKIGLIVVDYLHIMQLNNKHIVEALGDAVKDLRALSKELGCPVLLLSQLSRQPEKSGDDKKKPNRRPELSDLRASGEIEQSADIVIFLYRDSYYNQAGLVPKDDLAEAIIRKNRNGRTGIVELRWLPQYTKFKDRL